MSRSPRCDATPKDIEAWAWRHAAQQVIEALRLLSYAPPRRQVFAMLNALVSRN